MALHRAPLFATAVLVGAVLLAAQQPSPAAPATPAAVAPEKTAEQVYKNVAEFNGLPASELRSTMQFFADSLGVQCTFCHAFPFDADVKPQKATARRMIKMVFAINKDTFNGRPQVTCYTCHRGASRPDSALSVAAALTAPPAPLAFPAPGAAPAPGARRGRGPGNGPSAQQILDKYTAALGGAAALAGIHSAIITASRVNATGSSDETITRSGDKFVISDGAQGKSGFDGSQFFNWNPRFGARPAEGEAATQLQTEAGLYPAASLATDAGATKARVFGPVPMDSHSVYIMMVPGEGGMNSRYSFDATSGLLLRIDTGTPTFIGPLPLEVDFSDYRAAGGGVTLPYDVTYASHGQKWERKIASIQVNAEVPADSFTLPAGTGRRGGPNLGPGRGPGRGPTPPPPAQ